MKSRLNQTVLFQATAAAVASLLSAAAFAGTSSNTTASPVQQGTAGDGSNLPAITISFSGQTALRNFSSKAGISELAPGTSITLYNGLNGAPITYTAPVGSLTFAQLASSNFTSPDIGVNDPTATTQRQSAVRLEWHEQGSVQGELDLINDQVGYLTPGTPSSGTFGSTGYISNYGTRGPSAANPTWINTNQFTAGTTSNPAQSNGFLLSGNEYVNTYDTSVYQAATGRNISSGSFGGVNGQDRIQFSVGEYKTEGLSLPSSTPITTPFVPSDPAHSGSVLITTGYGTGNPALAKPVSGVSGLGSNGGRQQFQAATIVNESTDKYDPQTRAKYPTLSNGTAAPWATAGSDNIDSTQFAVTAVGLAANPGTGLFRINKGDAQWLQTAGRLQNGADFNVVTREVNTGQRIVPALNTGVDPSWAVGENDDGVSDLTHATAQHSIGSAIRFSGKTSGSESQKTISSSRLGIGPLSIAEMRGASSSSPVRALNIDFNDQTDPNNYNPANAGSFDFNAFAGKFISISLNSIVSNNDATRWKSVMISNYNTIKTPNEAALNAYLAANPSATAQQAWANIHTFNPNDFLPGATPDATVTGIKGDYRGTSTNAGSGNVAAFLANILNTTGSAVSGLGTFGDPNDPNHNINNPADALFSQGYLVPGLLDWTRQTDGGPITARPIDPNSQAGQVRQSLTDNGYSVLFSPANSPGANNQTIGTGSVYAPLNNQTTLNGSIPITSYLADGTAAANGSININGTNDAAPRGNYMFGNFDQDGHRDYASVKESLAAALALRHADPNGKNSIFASDGTFLLNGGTVAAVTSGVHEWDRTDLTGAGRTNTKGDLVALGDFNSDGKFDGQDLYLLARGASLSDDPNAAGASVDHLTTASGPSFADELRNPADKLNKNAALDYFNAQTAHDAGTGTLDADRDFLRQTGRAVLTGSHKPASATLIIHDNTTGLDTYTNDPTGSNAFNHYDVNRDGLINRQDAQIVDYFVGQNYHNLQQILAAVVRTDSNDGGTAFVNSGGAPLDPAADANSSIPRRQISLVDVEQNDNGGITNIASGPNSDGTGTSDFKLIRQALGTAGLRDGDSNFDGTVDSNDFTTLAANFGATNAKWSTGDFNFDGQVNALDFNALATNFGLSSSAPALVALVPEPTSLSLFMAVAGGVAIRRRRQV